MADDRLEQLLAKQAIMEVVFRYARSLDRLDEALLRSCFHPGSIHNHFFEGPSSDPSLTSTNDDPADFVTFALGRLSTYSLTHHQMGNTMVDLTDADHANVETYFTAFHRLRAIGDPLAGEQAFDTEMDYFVAGRYIDQFECREGSWAIISRTGMTDWVRLEAPSSQGVGMIPQATLGKRAPDDLICQYYST